MATTYTYKNGDGVQATTYSFTFPYIKEADVKVEVLESGAWVTKTKDTHYEFTNATTLKFLSGQVPANANNNIKISRSTDADKLTATFYPGSAIRSGDLNDNFTQNLYSTEEAKETGDDAQLATDRLVAVTYDGGTTWTQTGNNTDASTDPKGVGYSITQAEAAVVTADDAYDNAVKQSGVTPSGGANAAITIAEAASTTATNASNTAAAAFQRDGSATMTGNIVFEGTTDDANETTLTVVNPTADRTITLPNQSGTVPVLAAASNTQVTSTPEELNILDGVTSTAAELNILDGVTSTAAELNILDGVTSTTAELNYVDGVTSNVQTQLNAKQPLDADLTTLAGMQTETASILAGGTALTSTLSELNLLDGKSVVTTVSGSSTDVQLPTAKAVNDQIVSSLNDAGGFVPIADKDSFPEANPDPDDGAGTIISIADAGGLVVNGSGVSTTGDTITTNATVTINGIDSSLNNTTIAAGKGMLLQTTSTLNTYDYHRLTLDEAGVASAQTLVSDFNERYRTGTKTADNSNTNDDGDLFFDTGANTMYVYDGAYDAGGSWKEVTSAGDFKYLYLCPAGGTGAPTINGSIATYDLREGSNSGSAASVTSAAQLMVSVNGVTQQPNTGTSAPSLGYALVDSNTIIFGANLPTSAEVFIVQFGSALTINVPGDNTVSAAKIQSGAVETAKIADDAVTSAKLANSINTDIAAKAALAGATFTGGINIADGIKLTLGNGAGNDYNPGSFEIYENTDLYIESKGGHIRNKVPAAASVLLEGPTGSMAKFGEGGACELYYDDVKKLETTSGGVDLAGTLDVTGDATFGNSTTDAVVKVYGGGSDNVFEAHQEGTGAQLYITGGGNLTTAGTADFSGYINTTAQIYTGDAYAGNEGCYLASDGLIMGEQSVEGNDVFRGKYNGTTTSTIKGSGDATFAGNVVVGDTTTTGTYVKATRSDAGNVWSGNNATANTSSITKDGVASFGDMANGWGFQVNTGNLSFRTPDANSAASNAFVIYADGAAVSNKTASITKGGTATFKGRVNVGDATSLSDYGICAYNNASGTSASLYGQNSGTGDLLILYSGNNLRTTISAAGAATFASTVTCTSLTETSDQRFKKNITDAKPQLADVTALGGKLRNWDWNDEAPVSEKDIRFLGLIAQEVESICPGIIHTVPRTKDGEKELTPESTNEDGNVTPATYEQVDDSYKTIKTSVLIMKLLGAVTELSAKVAALEAA